MMNFIEFLINIIEATIFSGSCVYYFDIKKNKYIIFILTSLLIFLVVTTSNFFAKYDKILAYTYMLIPLITIKLFAKKNSIYEIFFISMSTVLLLNLANGLTLGFVSFINSQNLETVVNFGSAMRYLALFLSKGLFALFVIIFITSKNRLLIKSSTLTKKEWLGLDFILTLNYIGAEFQAGMIFSNNINYISIYIAFIILSFSGIVVYFIFYTLHSNAIKSITHQLKATELEKIQHEYIELRAKKSRYSKIEHELVYIQHLIGNKLTTKHNKEILSHVDEAKKLIQEERQTLFVNDYILNNFINNVIVLSKKVKKEVQVFVTDQNVSITLEINENLKNIASIIIDNSNSDINLRIETQNGHSIVKFIFSCSNKIIFDNNYLLTNQIIINGISTISIIF